MNERQNPTIKKPRQLIRKVCSACGGVRSLTGLTGMPVCRSERACLAFLLEEVKSR